jgi:hypothetical protein
LARVTAAGPISRNPAALHEISEDRLRKSSTLSPDENREVRPVGSTWLGPAT